METRVERSEAGCGGLDHAFEAAVDSGAEIGEMLPRVGQLLTRVVVKDRGCELGDTSLLKANTCSKHSIEAEVSIVEALAEAIEHGRDARLGAADGQVSEPLAELQQLKACCTLQAMRLCGEVLGDLMLCLGDELSGSGRCRCPQVSNEICDGEVGLVADGGNDGEFARCDGAGDWFAVECRKILERTTAARQDDKIDEAGSVELGER